MTQAMPAESVPNLAARLREAFSRRRLSLQKEEQLQDQVAEVLTEIGYSFRRECSLNEKDRVDFFVEGIGAALEVKITRDRYNILAQMRRYALSPFVKELILVCIVPISCPATLAGKPVHCVPVYTSLV